LACANNTYTAPPPAVWSCLSTVKLASSCSVHNWTNRPRCCRIRLLCSRSGYLSRTNTRNAPSAESSQRPDHRRQASHLDQPSYSHVPVSPKTKASIGAYRPEPRLGFVCVQPNNQSTHTSIGRSHRTTAQFPVGRLVPSAEPTLSFQLDASSLHQGHKQIACRRHRCDLSTLREFVGHIRLDIGPDSAITSGTTHRLFRSE
jgi:hypothetical protein